MRILHLSSSDGGGGAARAAYRLHDGLRRCGHDSAMLVHRRVTDDPAAIQFASGWSRPRRLWGWLRARRIRSEIDRYAAVRPQGLGPFSGDRGRFGRALPDAAARIAPEAVNLHWMSDDYFDYRDFFAVYPKVAPVVWTMHDMNLFTGGCHYNDACDRYLTGCGRCPQLGSGSVADSSRRIFRRKRMIFERLAESGRFRTVAASRWMGRLARASALLRGIPVEVIPHGLDGSRFQPLPADAVRRALGIADRDRMVLFVAENPAARRKGMAVLLEALAIVRRRVANIRLVCVGSPRRMPAAADLSMIALGSVTDDRLLALIYSAADVFVMPSLQEAFGLTALEAMACGTPVAGFDTGGIPDMVRPGLTGMLAAAGDPAALAEATAAILTDGGLRAKMAAQCRAVVLEEYTLERQAGEYMRLYTD